jgi:uncharacterized protein (TIGR02145 family)
MRAYLNSFLLATAICVGVFFTGCQEEETPVRVIETSTVVDIDGNVYKTVKIGNQWWMAENLAVTRFNDGSVLSFVDINSSDSAWANASGAAYTSLNNGQYGNLYNYAAVENIQNIAPAGWHVPTDEEWKTMEHEIGMAQEEVDALGWRGANEAIKLASLNAIGWPEDAPLFGTDEYGFNAKPGGCRSFLGATNFPGILAFWWSASVNGNEVWYRYIDANQTRIFRQHTYKGYGMSIRCVKNN